MTKPDLPDYCDPKYRSVGTPSVLLTEPQTKKVFKHFMDKAEIVYSSDTYLSHYQVVFDGLTSKPWGWNRVELHGHHLFLTAAIYVIPPGKVVWTKERKMAYIDNAYKWGMWNSSLFLRSSLVQSGDLPKPPTKPTRPDIRLIRNEKEVK